MSPLVIMIVYVLKCENEKHYVGKTDRNISIRIDEHKEGRVVWTRIHPVIKVVEVIEDADDFDENKYTKIYMSRFGIDNVRGGIYCQINLSKRVKQFLQKEIESIGDNCYRCGESGHFAKGCKNRNCKVVLERSVITCYKCGKVGHISRKCRSKSQREIVKETVTCEKCGKSGHISRYCILNGLFF